MGKSTATQEMPLRRGSTSGEHATVAVAVAVAVCVRVREGVADTDGRRDARDSVALDTRVPVQFGAVEAVPVPVAVSVVVDATDPDPDDVGVSEIGTNAQGQKRRSPSYSAFVASHAPAPLPIRHTPF